MKQGTGLDDQNRNTYLPRPRTVPQSFLVSPSDCTLSSSDLPAGLWPRLFLSFSSLWLRLFSLSGSFDWLLERVSLSLSFPRNREEENLALEDCGKIIHNENFTETRGNNTQLASIIQAKWNFIKSLVCPFFLLMYLHISNMQHSKQTSKCTFINIVSLHIPRNKTIWTAWKCQKFFFFLSV